MFFVVHWFILFVGRPTWQIFMWRVIFFTFDSATYQWMSFMLWNHRREGRSKGTRERCDEFIQMVLVDVVVGCRAILLSMRSFHCWSILWVMGVIRFSGTCIVCYDVPSRLGWTVVILNFPFHSDVFLDFFRGRRLHVLLRWSTAVCWR